MYENLKCCICNKRTGFYHGVEYKGKEYCELHLIDQIALNDEFKTFMIKEFERVGVKIILNTDNELKEHLVVKTYIGKTGTLKSMCAFAYGQFSMAFYQELKQNNEVIIKRED